MPNKIAYPMLNRKSCAQTESFYLQRFQFIFHFIHISGISMHVHIEYYKSLRHGTLNCLYLLNLRDDTGEILFATRVQV